jgi:hypothetical protein
VKDSFFDLLHNTLRRVEICQSLNMYVGHWTLHVYDRSHTLLFGIIG